MRIGREGGGQVQCDVRSGSSATYLKQSTAYLLKMLPFAFNLTKCNQDKEKPHSLLSAAVIP